MLSGAVLLTGLFRTFRFAGLFRPSGLFGLIRLFGLSGWCGSAWLFGPSRSCCAWGRLLSGPLLLPRLATVALLPTRLLRPSRPFTVRWGWGLLLLCAGTISPAFAFRGWFTFRGRLTFRCLRPPGGRLRFVARVGAVRAAPCLLAALRTAPFGSGAFGSGPSFSRPVPCLFGAGRLFAGGLFVTRIAAAVSLRVALAVEPEQADHHHDPGGDRHSGKCPDQRSADREGRRHHVAVSRNSGGRQDDTRNDDSDDQRWLYHRPEQAASAHHSDRRDSADDIACFEQHAYFALGLDVDECPDRGESEADQHGSPPGQATPWPGDRTLIPPDGSGGS